MPDDPPAGSPRAGGEHSAESVDPAPGAPAPATIAITAGRPHEAGAPLNAPIVPATSFIAGTPIGYSRAGNPTWVPFEDVVGELEGGRAYSFGSGMAAISAALDLLVERCSAQLPVVARPTVCYSGTTAYLDHLVEAGRVRVLEYDAGDADAAVAAATAADLLVVETPTNPTMAISDIAVLAAACAGPVMCDNTFATPLLTRPLDLGVDVVVHSGSKYLAGHSDVLIGVVVTRDDDLADAVLERRTLTGAVPGTLEAWLAVRGVRTLALRMREACRNAAELARRLATHPEVAWVRYPGLTDDPGHGVATRQMADFGAVVAFGPVGGEERAERFCEATELWLHATSLGGVESTLERRRKYSMESPETPPELVRLSVGCEDVEDLWSDLAAALAKTATTRT